MYNTRMAKHNDLGKLGESIAVQFLEKKGFKIIDRNYNKKWGELDIIALSPAKGVTRERDIVHIVEVKSTSRILKGEDSDISRENVSYETKDTYRPEEMLHPKKIERLKRTIQTYLLEKHIENWQFDLIVVYIDMQKRVARCKYLDDIIL